MRSRGRPRVALIVKRSAWDRHQKNPSERLQRLIDRRDPTAKNIRRTHDEHTATVAEVTRELRELDLAVVRIRTRVFDARGFDLVVTVGGDGTLLRASHNVDEVPVLAINSAPSSSVGFFCGAEAGALLGVFADVLAGKVGRVVLSRMQVRLNRTLLSRRVLNDVLFCHASPAATSRYILAYGAIVEEQKSSGLWMGPAAGSTAAQRSAGGRVLPLTSERLQLVVREPYTPRGVRYRLEHLVIEPGERVTVRAKSHEMRLYLDGPDQMVKVGLGDVIELTRSREPLTLLGISAERRWDRPDAKPID
ncbi:MAG: NAD(+) kinase [Myxococcales bacterium]|nr:NAD(+) kinase [Myxococcales bacterium]